MNSDFNISEDLADAADAIVQLDNGHIVLVRREFNPFKGFWSLPGGISNKGELARETAIREVEEETGLQISIIRLIGVYPDLWRTPSGFCACYLTRVIGGKLKSDLIPEVLEISFMDKLPPISEIAFDHGLWLRQAGFVVPE